MDPLVKRHVHRVPVLAAALVLGQLAWASRHVVGGVHLDLLLVLVLVVAISGGARRGALAGFAAGLLADASLPWALGVSMIAYTATGYAVGALADDANDLWHSSALLAAGGTLFATVLQLGVAHVVGDVHPRLGRTVHVLLFGVAFDVLVVPLAARSLRHAWGRRRDVAW